MQEQSPAEQILYPFACQKNVGWIPFISSLDLMWLFFVSRECWDQALYSILFQYASITVLHLLYKKFQQSTFFIVTTKPSEICKAIYEVSQRGATILEGEGSYEHCERNVVYSVISAAQAKKVIRVIRIADSDAFINEVKTQKLLGRFYQPKEQ